MSFKAFLLIVVIIIFGVFIYIKIQVNGSPDSHFNQTTRYTMGKYPILRKIFNLHGDGDARAEYLIGNTPIVVEVVQPSNLPLTDQVLQQFTSKIQEYTGRKTSLYNVDSIKGGTLTEADLQDIETGFHRHILPGQPNLFIIYSQDFGTDQKEVATTYKEFGIIVSDSKLTQLTANYPQSKADYTLSVLLHEFGHQVGLGHIDSNECVMSPKFHEPSAALSFSGSQIPTEFCSQELEELKNIKNSLQ